MTVAEIVAAFLARRGIDRVFGLQGGHNLEEADMTVVPFEHKSPSGTPVSRASAGHFPGAFRQIPCKNSQLMHAVTFSSDRRGFVP